MPAVQQVNNGVMTSSPQPNALTATQPSGTSMPPISNVNTATGQSGMATSSAQPYHTPTAPPAVVSTTPFQLMTTALSEYASNAYTTLRSYLGGSSKNTATLPDAPLTEPQSDDKPKVRKKRMYGNTETNNEKVDLSFAATIYNNQLGSPYCSGTILDEDTILTAAHCVFKKGPNDILVGVGSSHLADQTKLKVTKIIVDPQYDQPEWNPLDNENCGDYCDDYAESTENDEYSFDGDTVQTAATASSAKPVLEPTEAPWEFVDGTIEAEKYDLAILKVESGKIKELDLSYVPLPTEETTNQIQHICAHPDKISKQRLWVAGSGMIGNNDNPNDEPRYATDVVTGYVKLNDDQCPSNTTFYGQYDYKEEAIWCEGDSGAGVFHIDSKTKKAQLVGIVKSSAALAGSCINRSGYGEERIDTRATFVSPQMTAFMQSHLGSTEELTAWNGITGRHLDEVKEEAECSRKETLALRKKAKVRQQKADACRHIPSQQNKRNCRLKQHNALRFQHRLERRMQHCADKALNNDEGLQLTHTYSLNVNEHPKSASCMIKNLNNHDVLKFTPSAEQSQSITIMPGESVTCPSLNDHPLTQGSVTRPNNQGRAAAASAFPQHPQTVSSEVVMVTEKTAKAGENLGVSLNDCKIANTGKNPLKFEPTGKSHIRLMPREQVQCPIDNEKANQKGKLTSLHA